MKNQLQTSISDAANNSERTKRQQLWAKRECSKKNQNTPKSFTQKMVRFVAKWTFELTSMESSGVSKSRHGEDRACCTVETSRIIHRRNSWHNPSTCVRCSTISWTRIVDKRSGTQLKKTSYGRHAYLILHSMRRNRLILIGAAA